MVFKPLWLRTSIAATNFPSELLNSNTYQKPFLRKETYDYTTPHTQTGWLSFMPVTDGLFHET